MNDKLTNLEKNREAKFKCKECKYTTASEQGLKTHVAKKHKTAQKKEEMLTFPITCELCDKELRDKKEMVKHQKNHSYKFVAYKCVKCDFLGEDEIGMEVHLGKEHGEKFVCGLCDYIAKSLENLETHLSTCETYVCTICDTIFTNLSEIKTHFLQNHEAKHRSRFVKHIKQNRENHEAFDDKSYCYNELFTEF